MFVCAAFENTGNGALAACHLDLELASIGANMLSQASFTLCGPVAVCSRVARKPPPSRAAGRLLARSPFARRQRQNGDRRHRCTYGGHVYITSVEVFSCTYFYRDSNHAVEMFVMHRGVHDHLLQQ